jgi:hypothetical protein
MRLRMDLENTSDPQLQEVLSHFASFLLRIGEDVEPSPINLPLHISQPQEVKELVEHVFDDFSYNDPLYWSERAILCPKNKDVQQINDMVSSRLPHDEHVFLSIQLNPPQVRQIRHCQGIDSKNLVKSSSSGMQL